LHRLDNLGRAAKRSQPYENQAIVTNRLWCSSSPRTPLNTGAPVGLDLDDLLQRRTDKSERMALIDSNFIVQEGSQENLLHESDFDSDSSNSEDDSSDEDELLLVEDWAILADDNNISVLKQSRSQGSISEALHTSVCQAFGSSNPLAFTPEMSREATAAFLSQGIQTAIPCKLLESFVIRHVEYLPTSLLTFYISCCPGVYKPVQ